MTANLGASGPTSADRLASLFDDPNGGDARPWYRRHRRTGIVVVVIAIAAVIAFATNAFGSNDSSYRVAIVGNHNVDSLLTNVATIEPVTQASVAFPVSGTVSAVNVKVGDQVAAGQSLAALDPTSLMQTLHSEQAALAQAQLTLSKALSGQSVGGAGGGGGGSGNSGTGGTGNGQTSLSSARSGAVPTAVLTAGTPTDPQLATLQQAVITAQQGVDAALATSKSALDNATTVCAAAGTSQTSPPATGTTGTQGATTQDSGLTACQTALQNVLTAQNAVDTAQHTLADASTALDNYLAQRAATPPPTTTPPTSTPTTTPRTAAPSTASGGNGTRSGSGSSSTGSSGASGFSGSGSRSSTSSAPSAADIASYQAAVDAAQANVAVAFQALSQATITTPITGQVVAVNLTPGAGVSSSSASTENIVVQGAGGMEVTTSVNVTKIADVAVGQAASVVPDGTHTSLAGKVTSISVAPTSSSNSSTTSYRVVVGLDNPNQKLSNGSTGTVTIVTKSAKSSLAVPTSAITAIGRRYTVTVVQDGSPTTVLVGVGVIGAQWTEITSGLTRGEEVVLANVSTPLPSSATSSSNGTTGTNGTNGLGGGRFTFPGGGQFRIGVRPGG
jgi:HlyD family secretion protein